MRYTKKTYKKNKKNKKNKKSKKNNKTKRIFKHGGNSNEEIDLRQILITEPIINVIKEYNSVIDLNQFKLSKSNPGFRLPRMEKMMQSNFDELIQNEPIELKIARNNDGKMIGLKIDGTMKKAYEIINGRHRIARAIIDGKKTINAVIL
jgi:hypothetical protein